MPWTISDAPPDATAHLSVDRKVGSGLQRYLETLSAEGVLDRVIEAERAARVETSEAIAASELMQLLRDTAAHH